MLGRTTNQLDRNSANTLSGPPPHDTLEGLEAPVMPKLLNLPNELLLAVIEVLDPAEILPFALCSRRLHKLSAKRLARHLHLRHRFEYDLPQSQVEVSQPIDLLLELQNQPDIRWYPRAVSLSYEDVDESEFLDAVALADHFDDLLLYLTGSDIEDVKIDLQDSLIDGSQSTVAALLVLLLHNLVTLKVDRNLFEDKAISDVFRACAKWGRSNPMLS